MNKLLDEKGSILAVEEKYHIIQAYEQVGIEGLKEIIEAGREDERER